MGKTPPRGREEEFFQISQFLRLRGIPEENCSFTVHDPPDAVIVQNTHRISLEHTEHLVDKEREQESIRRACVARAKSKFTSKYKKKFISAHVLFDNITNITNDMIDQYATRICDGVLHFVDAVHEIRSRHKYGNVTLHLSQVQDSIYARWRCTNNSVGFSKKIREEALAKRLSKKDAGLRRYREEYDENWLLIFVDITKGSSMYTLSEPPTHATMFDKVFVSTDQEFIELERATTARAPKEDD